MSSFSQYVRPVDAGNGKQVVIAINGVIVHQRLVANRGNYTGDGNPDLVGKPVSALRGMGFRKTRSHSKLDDSRLQFEISQDYRTYVKGE